MRKTNRIISMMMLTIIALHTNNLFAPYRPGKNIPKSPQPPKSSQPIKGGGPTVNKTPPAKTDAQKKQELVALDKKINQGTKQLADAVKNKQKAQTPEEKKLANKKIVENAKKVLGWITVSRNISGELMGYSKDEIEDANAVLDDLKNRCAALQGLVNELKEDRKKLLVEGWKGRWLGSIKPDKKAEYAKITKKIDKLEPELTKLNDAVRSQKIIAGEQKFSKTRAFAATSLALAVGATAAYTLIGPMTLKTEYDEFKKNPREYLTNRAATFKNMVSGLLSSTATKEAVTNAAGNALSETLTQSILRYSGQAAVALVNEALAITKDITKGVIVQATIAPAVMLTLQTLREKLEELLKDPDANQEPIQETSQEIITIAEKNGIKTAQKK